MAQPSGDSRFVEEARVVIAVQCQAVLRFDDVQEDIEVDKALRIRIDVDVESIKVHGPTEAFEIELHLHERQATRIPWQRQLADKSAVGVVLVLIPC